MEGPWFCFSKCKSHTQRKASSLSGYQWPSLCAISRPAIGFPRTLLELEENTKGFDLETHSQHNPVDKKEWPNIRSGGAEIYKTPEKKTSCNELENILRSCNSLQDVNSVLASCKTSSTPTVQSASSKKKSGASSSKSITRDKLKVIKSFNSRRFPSSRWMQCGRHYWSLEVLALAEDPP